MVLIPTTEAGPIRILVLAPHTDDAEVACGGSIAKFIEDGHEVYYAAFSSCEDSVPDGFPKDVLRREMREATAVLGIPEDRVTLYDYPVRLFTEHRQAILEDLIVLRDRLKPGLVLLPSVHDLHQDHGVIAAEGIRAFKGTTVLGYEEPWNTIQFSTSVFVILKPHHLEQKLQALKQYRSQQHRPYAKESFLRALSETRGVAIGRECAEAFEVVRWVID